MSPAGISPDARAVVRAFDGLTTQVRRIADALTTPVVERADATDDAATTPRLLGMQVAVDPAADPATLAPNRLRQHLPPYPGEQAPAADNYERTTGHHITCAAGFGGSCECPPVADEDAQRTERRASIRNLLDRIDRYVVWTPAETELLRQQVQAELRLSDQLRAGRETWKGKAEEVERDRDQHAAILAEVLAAFVHKVDGYRIPRRSAEADVVTLEKWRSVVAPTADRPWWVTVDEVRAELAEAQAAIERVRALHRKASHGTTCVYCAHGQRLGYDTDWPCDTIRALDGTEQPTT